MGTKHRLLCENCGYFVDYYEGINMFHPQICKQILYEMKAGDYGEEFKKYATILSNPAVHMQEALFQCEACGALKGDKILEICEKVGEYPPYVKGSWRGVDNLEKFPMALNGVHKTVYRKHHICECGAEMLPITRVGQMNCPQCQSTLKSIMTGCFD